MSSGIALAGLIVVVLSVVGLHFLMSRFGPAWLGAVLPACFVIAVVVLIAQGRLEPGRQYVAVGATLVMLLSIWSGGHQAKGKAKAAPDSRPLL